MCISICAYACVYVRWNMRKRINLVFILLLGIVMTLMLVACNQKTPNKLPDDIGSGSSSEDEGLTPSLVFEFPVELNSVFNSISLDHFVLEEYVTYSIEYANDAGEIKKVVKGGGLKTEMVDEDCRQYLTKAGHHDIKVTVPLGDSGKTVKGGFKLHLKDSSGVISLAKFTFNLRDINGGGVAYPYFASNIDSDRGIATKSLEVGVEISSWNEFISLFKMSLSGKALERVTAQGKTYDATGRNFPLVVSGDLTFDMAWTDDIVNVKYDLNVPKDAVRLSTAPDPKPLFADGGKYGNVTAVRRVGPALQPDDEEINVYNGYYFGGWFNKADGKLWRFSSAVGDSDLELVAKWVLADYSFTIYPMGGDFAKNLQASTTDNGTVINRINAERLGYIIIESSSRFGLSDGSLNRIMFTGFHYGISYDKYVAEVTINPKGEKVMLKFSEFYRPKEAEQTILVKGDGDYLKIDDLYSDYQCTEPLDRGDSNVNAEQPVTYIKWLFNEPDKGNSNYRTLFDNRISAYYRELVFKGGIDVLADGSLRLRQVADWAVNELIVPEYLKYGEVMRPITEIGEEALANMKALTLVDLSRASKLTTIGKQAFAYDESLSEIIMPEDNSISLIGDKAFIGTDFENNFYENNHGAEFIVIGNMIYKYVGKDKSEIDLSNPSVYYTEANSPNMSQDERNRFNGELTRVTSIEDGAFALCPSLSVLSIPAGLTAIKNNALSGLTYFRTLNLPQSGSKLLNIGESAFDGTLFLSERGSLYDGNINAIIIGNVYYRLINRNATRARIPASRNNYAITHIAPRAFMGCGELEDIVFDDVTKITEVGKEAFLDTKYVKVAKQGDNFTEVNGILTHYYGPTKNTNESNLIVPSRVTRIGTYAFGKQAEYFSTLQINSSVKKIDNYAFAGARMLVSIIFPQMGISGSVLTNAPEISEYAFAGENGEMNVDTMLYFSKAVIGLFNDLEDGKTSTTDAVTLQWFNLYKLNKAHFIVEDIKSIVINRNVISTNLLKTGKTASAFTDTYGTTPIEGALIITSNTGVARRADLSWSGNGMEIIEITDDPNSKYFSLWEKGKRGYVITYKYNGETTGCPTEADDDGLFIVTIHNDVKGNPDFFSSANYPHNESKIDANKLTSDGNMWFEGLESQVANSEIPTFYTSNPGLNVVFVYRDIANNVVRITPSRIDNLRVNSEADKAFATIYVNFYGLGTYVFDFEYAVRRSKFEAIEQTMEVAVPINANSADFMRNYSVNLIGEDGNKEAFALTRSNFNIKKVDGKDTTVVDTSTLGMHTITIEYTKNDAKNRLEFDLHYTVILEADETLFSYEILNKSHRTAIITGCKASTDITTIVLPSRCEINGVTYTVTQLGRMQGQYTGVFEGYNRLSSVYLSETIENIGVNTFRGCIRLKNVFTAVQAVSSPVVIPADDTHFAKAGDSFKETDGSGVEWTVTPVKLLTLANVNMRATNELIIANDYVVNATEHTKYRIVAIENGLRINAEFDKIDVYLPDTIYNAVNIVDSNGNAIVPIYYSSGSNFMIKTVDRAPELLDYIGVGAFNGCISLVGIDLSHSVKLRLIGSLAFANTGLKSIDLSANTDLVEIGNQLFENCTSLETVKLHSGIRQIGANAFSGAELLTSIEGLSDSLVRIDSLAFNRCKSLYRIDLYSSVAMIGSDAFSGCKALTLYCHFAADAVPAGWSANWSGDCAVVFNCDTNDVAKDNLIYVVEDGIRYALNTENKQATVVGQAYALKGTVTILASVTYKGETYDVTTIKASAFEGNDRITDVVATSKLKVIDANAFKDCINLATFTITGDNNLEVIKSTAFENCDKLANVPQVGA